MSGAIPGARDPATSDPGERLVVVPLGALIWIAVGVLFVSLRVWPIWGTPVGGAELVHLSGAWNAHVGVEDSRYIPTLFQAMVAGLFTLTSSEVPARILSFAATATLPFALWSLRDRLGETGALIALVLLAFDAPSLAVGAESGAMGFDVAVTVWLVALGTRANVAPWQWAILAFAVAASGPLPLPAALALVLAWLLGGGRIDARNAAWPTVGALVGIGFTTLRPGLGPDGFTVAPFELFGAGYEQDWSTADTLAVAAMTSWPLLLAGLAGAAWWLAPAFRGSTLGHFERVLLLWGALGLGWFLTSVPGHAVAPLAGATIPAALLAGPAMAALFPAIRQAEWALARFLVPAAASGLFIVVFFVGDWAKLDRVGDTQDKLIVIGISFAVLAIVGALGADRRTLPLLGAMALPIAAAPMLVATSVVAFRAGDSPIPSPVSRPAARELRDIALDAVREGGTIAIHRDFGDELTWPFRDSGNVVLASRIPDDAAIVIWPASGPSALAAPPPGFAAIEEEWALIERVEPPTRFLPLARWYSDRYSLANTDEPVAVYLRETE